LKNNVSLHDLHIQLLLASTFLLRPLEQSPTNKEQSSTATATATATALLFYYYDQRNNNREQSRETPAGQILSSRRIGTTPTERDTSHVYAGDIPARFVLQLSGGRRSGVGRKCQIDI